MVLPLIALPSGDPRHEPLSVSAGCHLLEALIMVH